MVTIPDAIEQSNKVDVLTWQTQNVFAIAPGILTLIDLVSLSMLKF